MSKADDERLKRRCMQECGYKPDLTRTPQQRRREKVDTDKHFASRAPYAPYAPKDRTKCK